MCGHHEVHHELIPHVVTNQHLKLVCGLGSRYSGAPLNVHVFGSVSSRLIALYYGVNCGVGTNRIDQTS